MNLAAEKRIITRFPLIAVTETLMLFSVQKKNHLKFSEVQSNSTILSGITLPENI